VQNVILDGENLLWIDLMDWKKATSSWRCWDAEKLTRSILCVSSEVASSEVVLDNVLMQLIKQYGELSTLESINSLSTEVYKRLGHRTILQSLQLSSQVHTFPSAPQYLALH